MISSSGLLGVSILFFTWVWCVIRDEVVNGIGDYRDMSIY